MAPNSKSESDIGILPTENSKEKRLEILCDGFYYDVTDFISRHPGGTVITYYTEKGEDATQAIQQFHNRSAKKVQALMRSFKKRPATNADAVLDSERSRKHQALTKDFTELFLEIKKEGLFESNYPYIFYRIAQLLFGFYITLTLMHSPYFLVRSFAYAVLGITMGQAGYLGHELGHRSFTNMPKFEKFLHSAVYGLFIGLSGNWWVRNHNRHHAMPQRLHHDIDLDTLPFIAFNTKVVKDPKEGKSFFVQNQAWLFMSIDATLGIMSWRLYHCPKNAFKKGNYLDLFFMALHWVFMYKVYSVMGLFANIFGFWVGANKMYSTFALSHSHTPVTEDATHWVEYGLIHTIDVTPGPFVDWWMGYLNYQIEHHLFPTLPHYRAHLITKRVKALAEKHGLPYRCLTYGEAWRLMINNMKTVAKQLATQ